MAIPFKALQDAVDTHPASALVALPVSLVREMLPYLPGGELHHPVPSIAAPAAGAAA